MSKMKYILDVNDNKVKQAMIDLAMDPQQLLIR